VERVQLEKNVFVKWVGFLVWGLDHLQLVSQKIPKHLETYQNIPKHTKKSQRKKRSEMRPKFFCLAFLAADFFVFILGCFLLGKLESAAGWYNI